jgi:hypothetical protein
MNRLKSDKEWLDEEAGVIFSKTTIRMIQADALRYAAALIRQNSLNFQCVDVSVQQLEKEVEELCNIS